MVLPPTLRSIQRISTKEWVWLVFTSIVVECTVNTRDSRPTGWCLSRAQTPRERNPPTGHHTALAKKKWKARESRFSPIAALRARFHPLSLSQKLFSLFFSLSRTACCYNNRRMRAIVIFPLTFNTLHLQHNARPLYMRRFSHTHSLPLPSLLACLPFYFRLHFYQSVAHTATASFLSLSHWAENSIFFVSTTTTKGEKGDFCCWKNTLIFYFSKKNTINTFTAEIKGWREATKSYCQHFGSPRCGRETLFFGISIWKLFFSKIFLLKSWILPLVCVCVFRWFLFFFFLFVLLFYCFFLWSSEIFVSF